MNLSDIPFRKNGDDFDAAWVNTIVQALKDFLSTYTDDMADKADQSDVDDAINDINSDLIAHEEDTSTHGVEGDIVGTSDAQVLSNKEFSDPITFDQITTPANPVTGKNKLYPKSDNTFYTLDSNGNEVPVGSGSGGGVKNYFTDSKFDLNTNAAKVYNDRQVSLLGDSSTYTNTIKFSDATSMKVGDKIIYDNGGETSFSGLTDGETYYINYVEENNFVKDYGLVKDTITGKLADCIELGGFPDDYTSGTHSFTRIYGGTQGTADADHLAVSVNKTDPQSGLGSLEIDYTYAASTSALGEGVRIGTNKIDVQDQGKALYCYTYLNFKDANYPSGDMKFKLWDETNSKEIDLEALGIDTKIYNDARGYNFVFVPPTSTREYYFSLHSVDDNATASWKGKCGTFVMTPQGTVPGAIITAPESYTPTFTGFGTPTGVNFTWWREGHFLAISGAFTPSTTTATEARISLPNEFVSDSSLPTLQTCGLLSAAVTGTSTSNDLAVLIEASKSYVVFRKPSAAAISKANADDLTTTNTMSFFAKVPIKGWQATHTLGTNELAITPVKIRLSSSSALTLSTSAPVLKYENVDEDNNGWYSADTGITTIGKDVELSFGGYFKSAAHAMSVGYGESLNLYRIRNSVTTKIGTLAGFRYPSSDAVIGEGPISAAAFRFLAGDQIYIAGAADASVNLNGDAASNYVTMTEVPSFSKFSVYDDQSVDMKIIYPNSGTEASPASVAVNSRYVEDNPFPGYYVQCIAEIKIDGKWGPTGFVYDSSDSVGYGVACDQYDDDKIVVQTGSGQLVGTSARAGNPHNIADTTTTSLPCRVKVIKLAKVPT